MNWVREYLKEKTIPAQVRKTYESIVDNIKESKAVRVIEFVERFCRHSKGDFFGRPFELALFQKAFLSALFGCLKADGRRRYREAFLLVGRKNGKSTLAAAIALYCLLTERGAEVYSAATKRDQAAIIFNEAHNMVRQSPSLRRAIRKRKTDLYYERGLGVLKPLSKNANSLDGVNASLIILDEAHALTDRGIYEVLKQSQSARAEPLFVTITTAGTVRESIYDDLYSIAKDPPEDFLAVCYEGAELDNPESWFLSNPGLGTIKRLDDLESRVARAKDNPVELAGLLCKDFNVIQNTSQAWGTWAILDNPATFELTDFKDCYGIGSFDLSRVGDLTAACVLLKKEDTLYAYEHFWLPADLFKVHCDDGIPYQRWLDRGFLSLCPGGIINPDMVADWFSGLPCLVPWIYYDAWSAAQIVKKLELAGVKMDSCIGVADLGKHLAR